MKNTEAVMLVSKNNFDFIPLIQAHGWIYHMGRRKGPRAESGPSMMKEKKYKPFLGGFVIFFVGLHRNMT